ncbi:MAG TPA: hypothetical protein ENJ08_11145 [Gammaproteobacteria bacterium]|nr:hypothetical protein [Gammaproteobacteria bacterium]
MSNQTLKERFIEAINEGELGLMDDYGVLITREAFAEYFSDIKTQYKTSFLTGAVIESGRIDASQTRFLFRLGRGLYRVHVDLLEAKPRKEYRTHNHFFMDIDRMKVAGQ